MVVTAAAVAAVLAGDFAADLAAAGLARAGLLPGAALRTAPLAVVVMAWPPWLDLARAYPPTGPQRQPSAVRPLNAADDGQTKGQPSLPLRDARGRDAGRT
jgi:hypothetical protein